MAYDRKQTKVHSVDSVEWPSERTRRTSTDVDFSNEVGKGLEDNVRASMERSARLQSYVERQEALKRQESTSNVQDMLKAGEITEEDAQKLFTRAKMRQGNRTNAELDSAIAAGADYVTTEQMLEDALEVETRSFIFRVLKQITGFSFVQQHVNRERTRRNSPQFDHPFPNTQKMVKSPAFEVIVGIAMIVNGVLIGAQTSTADGEASKTYEMLEHIFTSLFCFEVFLRMLADGWIWVFDTSHAMDLGLIIFTGVVPLWILSPFGIKSDLVRALQVLRVVRLVRLIRLVRTLRLFRTLWSLLGGLVDSRNSLLWTYLVLGCVIYIFSIFCVRLLGHRTEQYRGDPVAEEYFGDVPRASITLFQVMTLDSWSFIARHLMKDNLVAALVFVLSIAVLTLVLMNLITAVIVNNAFQRALLDEELQAVQNREKAQSDIEELRRIFMDIDTDGNGWLSQEEFLTAVQTNFQIQWKLQLLNINKGEEKDLWDIMELHPETGEVHVDNFAGCLHAMQGDAKAKDSFSIVQKIIRLNVRLQRMSKQIRACTEKAEALCKEVKELQTHMFELLLDVQEFVGLAGSCVPSAPAPLTEAELDRVLNSLAKKSRATKAAVMITRVTNQ